MPYIRKILNSETGDQEDKQMFPVLDASTNAVIDLIDLNGADWRSYTPGVGLIMGEPDHDNIAIGNTWEINKYVTPALSKNELKAYAATKRWRAETGGITVSGIAIPTDDRAKLLLMGAAQKMADGGTATFVTADVAVSLTGVQYKAIYAAIVDHVEALFEAQALVIAGIESEIITSIQQIDDANWP